MARPTDCNPQVTKIVAASVRAGLSYAAAAARAGISVTSINEWRRRGAEGEEPFALFAEEVARARADRLAELEERLDLEARSANGGNGDWRATLSILKHRYPEEWNTPERHELTGADGGPVQLAAQVVEIPAQVPDAAAWATLAASSTVGADDNAEGE